MIEHVLVVDRNVKIVLTRFNLCELVIEMSIEGIKRLSLSDSVVKITFDHLIKVNDNVFVGVKSDPPDPDFRKPSHIIQADPILDMGFNGSGQL